MFTEFFVRSGGSNLNAGSTDADAAVLSLTGGDWVQSTRVYTKTGAITGVSVGDFASIYVDGAGAPTGYVSRVTAVTANTVTLSSTALSGTAPANQTATCSMKVGGAWGGSSAGDVSHSLTFPATAMTDASGNPVRVNLKATTWSITTGITRSAGGPIYFSGYTTTPGDGGFAVIDGSTNAIVLLTLTGSGNAFAWLEFANNGTTGTNSLVSLTGSIRAQFYRCRFHDARGHGLGGASANGSAVECEAWQCNTSNTADLAGIATGWAVRCVSHDHTTATTNGNGFNCNTQIDCIADRCSGYGFAITGTCLMLNCSTYNCINGAKTTASTTPVAYIENCNFVNNTTNGISSGSASYILIHSGGGFQANTGGSYNATASLQVWEPVAAVALAGNPYTAVSTSVRPTAGDFTVQAGLGQGAGNGNYLMASSSYSSTTTSYPDRGAVQHQDAGGGGIFDPLGSGFIQ